MRYYPKDQVNFPSSNGIYSIGFENASNNKVYIGSASKSNDKPYKIGFLSRWRSHLYSLRLNKHFSKKLQNAYNKYGEEFLYFEVIEICEPELCLEREQFYIDEFNACHCGYNSRPSASSSLGFKHSEETKDRQKLEAQEKRKKHYTEISKLFDEGLNFRQIAPIVKLDHHTVSSIFRQFSDKKVPHGSHYSKKKVFQYDLSGNFLKEFSSVSEAALELNMSGASINNVLNGKNIHARKFFFSCERIDYKTAVEIISERRLKKFQKKRAALKLRHSNSPFVKTVKNIHQYDLDGNFIKTWANYKEIMDFFKLESSSQISNALKGRKFRGFLWTLNHPN